MKKHFAQKAAIAMLIACSLTAGCSQTASSTGEPAGSTQTAAEQQQTAAEQQQAAAEQYIVIESEAGSTESDENLSTEAASSQAESGSAQVLHGYTLQDGMDVPAEIRFQMTDLKRGEDAYAVLSANQPDLPEAEPGMEYIVATFRVTYESGGPDVLMFGESHASLDDAKLFFFLSNGDSNAEQLTNLLSDAFYSLSLEKGNSGTGSVAFLHKADSGEPLRFIGFGSALDFDINQ